MKAIDLLSAIKTRFGDAIVDSRVCIGEVTIELKADDLLSVSEALRDEKEFQFDQLIDVCGVDYSHSVRQSGPPNQPPIQALVVV